MAGDHSSIGRPCTRATLARGAAAVNGGMLCGMPIYEYRCEPCAEKFEELVRGPGATIACPRCGSAEVERLLSAFAGVGGQAAAMPEHPRLGSAAGGSCCGGACGHAH